MAELYYHELDVASSLETGDKGRLQRREGGTWRDYQFDISASGLYFEQSYQITDLVSNPLQNLGPAAPAGKGYVILPTSWASYEPGAGHVDAAPLFYITDSSGITPMQAFGLLFRAGATVYGAINSAEGSTNNLSETNQLMINAAALVAGDGTLRIWINYILIDI